MPWLGRLPTVVSDCDTAHVLLQIQWPIHMLRVAAHEVAERVMLEDKLDSFVGVVMKNVLCI